MSCAVFNLCIPIALRSLDIYISLTRAFFLSCPRKNRSAVKDAKKASKKEKNLKRIIGGLGGFLVVFALIFLGVQGQSLSESINEAKIT